MRTGTRPGTGPLTGGFHQCESVPGAVAGAPTLVERDRGLFQEPLGLRGGEVRDPFRRDPLDATRGEGAGIHAGHAPEGDREPVAGRKADPSVRLGVTAGVSGLRASDIEGTRGGS